MHVLYFHQYFSTPEGATGLRSYQMAKRLVEQGHRVTMVCASRARGHTGATGEPRRGIRRGTVDGIDVIEVCISYSNYDSLFKRSLTFLRLAWRNLRIAARTDYDLLFATSTPLTAGIPGIAMRLLKPRRPSVFEVRDLWPELPKAMGVIRNPLVLSAMAVLERLSYASANAVVALSPGIERGVRKRSGDSKTVVMIPNGCDLELFDRISDDTDSLLEPYQEHLSKASLRAVFTGAHGMANGLDAVLNAAVVLKSRGRNDILLFLVGNGRMKPGLMTRAANEKLDNVVFLDYMKKRTFAAFMKHMDVGLMILANVPAFYYGTSPNKFFDYIALGMPVLNNYPGWLADMIGEHEAGLVVPPQDPSAFADALEQLAGDADERRRMGARARALAEDQFNRKDLSGRFVACLESVRSK